MDSPIITKKSLILVSGAADALDVLLIAGLAPGPWSIIVDAPATICHFLYAGPWAITVLSEYIPIIGFFPIYTIAACMYPNKHKQAKPANTFNVTTPPPSPRQAANMPPLPKNQPTVIDVPDSSPTVADRLRALDRLHAEKLISDAEYQDKRAKILGGI